jgi:hypothetical protein
MPAYRTLLPYQRNIADNIRAEHGIPASVSDADILDLYEELSPMDGEELTWFLREEFARTGDWHAIVSACHPVHMFA